MREKLKPWLIACALFFVPLSFAQGFHLDSNKYIKYVVKSHKENPKSFNKIDLKPIVLHPKDETRLDLFMCNIIDQSEKVLRDSKYKKEFQEFKEITKYLPLRNFPRFYQWLKDIASKNSDNKLGKKLGKITPQVFRTDSIARVSKLDIHKKNQGQRLKQIKAQVYYNKIAFLPEGENLLRFIALKRFENSRWSCPRATTTKIKSLKQSDIKFLRRKYYTQYANAFLSVERKHSSEEGTYSYFKFEINANKRNPLRFTKHEAKTEAQKKIEPLFRNIQRSSNKNAFLLYLSRYYPEVPLVKANIYSSVNMLFLTPTQTLLHTETVFRAFRNFQFTDQLFKLNDTVVQKIRMWLKENRDDFEEKTGLSIGGTSRIRRSKVLELTPYLLQHYPEHPWFSKNVFIKDSGALKLSNDSDILRGLFSSFQFFKNTFSLENLAATSVGIATNILTANPFVGIATYSVTHDVVKALRYDKNMLEELKNSPRRIAFGYVLAAGFIPGELAHNIAIGGVAGGVQAIFTGRPLELGVIVGGAVEGVLFAVLPNGKTRLVAKGINKNLTNALLEITENSLKGATKGFIIAVLDDGDGLTGLKEGAIYGSVEAGVRILLLGFRYDPTDMVSSEDLVRYADEEHNPVVAERAYQGEHLYVTKEQFNNIDWRKDSFARLLGINKKVSFETAGVVSMSPGAIQDIDTLVHESLHYAQELKFGAFNFYLKYLQSISRNGASIYEDYVLCDGIVCH